MGKTLYLPPTQTHVPLAGDLSHLIMICGGKKIKNKSFSLVHRLREQSILVQNPRRILSFPAKAVNQVLLHMLAIHTLLPKLALLITLRACARGKVIGLSVCCCRYRCPENGKCRDIDIEQAINGTNV